MGKCINCGKEKEEHILGTRKENMKLAMVCPNTIFKIKQKIFEEDSQSA